MIRCALLLGQVALVAALPERAPALEPASCSAEVALLPSRAVVGEQVLYRVRITSRDDVDAVEWSHPPSFPSLRTETLPGDPQPGDADAGPEERVRDERRALFAERSGTLLLRAPELRCRSRGGAVEVVAVPEVALEVAALPEPGRPESFDGQVGPLVVYVTVTPQTLRVGESVRVAVMAQGAGNLWTLPQPFAEGDFAGAEVFAERPELVLARGPGLFLRHHFAYDVVPREAGVLAVPALAIPYFDPETGGYRVARSEAVRVTVGERAAPARQPASASPRAPAPGEPPERQLAWWLVLPGVLVLVPLLWRLRGAPRSADEQARAALAEARSLEASGDPAELAAALARALRAALAPHVDDAASAAPEELIARGTLPAAVSAAAHLLASLERARFDPEAPPPDPEAVRRVIREL